MQVALTTGYY